MASPAPSPEPWSGPPPSACRVLLLDDDESVRITLGAVLSQKGFDVSPAASLREARKELQATTFDVIVADLRLDDGQSGADMLAEALAGDPDLVTIVLTAYVSTAAAVEALRGGATNFLAKPCNIDDLVDAIQRGLEKRTLLRELRAARQEAAAHREAEEARAEASRLLEELQYVHEQLQRSHAGSELLAAIGKELASSLNLQELIERLARAVVPAFADWCVVDVVEEDYRQLVAVAHVDPAKEPLAQEVQRRFQPISSKHSPMRRVLDSGEPRYIADYTLNLAPRDGLQGRDLELLERLSPKSIITVPLEGRHGTIGVMSFLHSDSSRRFTPDDLALARELGNRAALAIENAQLYRKTERAAAERQQSEERQRFLAEASKLLDSSLDYQATLESLARLCVPVLADWCAVDVPERNRLGESLAIAHSDPAKVQLARQLQQRWPAEMSDPRGVPHVIRTGESEVYPEILEQLLVASAKDEEHLRVIRALGPWTSGMVVPLKARGKTLGAMSLITAESGRKYGPEDLEFALDLANRAAVAVDNARLYSAEQRARREAERLQALTEKLGRGLTPESVFDQIAETAAELLDSPVAGVFLLDPLGESFALVAGRGLEMGSELRLPRSSSLAGQVIASSAAMTVADARTAPVTALPQLVSGEAVGSLVVAPIVSTSGALGAVEVYSTELGAFEQHDAELLSALAGAAAAVLENARLYRQREADLARLHTIVEQLPVGIVVVEAPTGAVSLKNRQAVELYGAALEDLRPGVRDLRQGFHADGTAYDLHEWPLARALAHGQVVSAERVEIERPDGGRSHLSINAAPIRDGEGTIVAAVTVFDDVSGEEELRRQKEQFLAAAAHDLKTPLTSIRGLVQLLERQLGHVELPRPERIRATLVGLDSANRKMAALIDELLDVSRLENLGSLALSRSETDLVELARKVIQTHTSAAPHHQLQVDAAVERLTGLWDEARLERALSNLVGNAVKYSPEGGVVQVSVASHDGDAVLSISDQGIGIPAGELERIFERFQRGSNVPQGLSGSGIGLSYVRNIVLQHGGSIHVRSQPGQGSCFSMRLPRGKC